MEGQALYLRRETELAAVQGSLDIHDASVKGSTDPPPELSQQSNIQRGLSSGAGNRGLCRHRKTDTHNGQ
jgi:hypothetical protein